MFEDYVASFFNKYTTQIDNYLLDTKSNKKLYLRKSHCVKPTSVTTIAKVTDFPYDSVKKIEMLFYHDTDEIANLGFSFGSENTLPSYATTGFYISTNKILYNLYWKGSAPNACAVNVSALENKNWYKMTALIAANISYKLNKMTIVNSLITTGSDINSTSTPAGTQTPYSVMGIFGLLLSNNTSNYSSQHRIAYIKFFGDNDELLYDFEFCNGAGTRIFDLVSGDSFLITNLNEVSFHNYKQDFVHKNFKNGFTKYIKSAANDILVTNSNSGDQITTTEAGYSVVRNVNGCNGKFWNGCESKLKFDDVGTIDDLYTADKNHIWFDEITGEAKEVSLGTDFTCDGLNSSNEGFMFINDILNYNTINFYIFNEDKILLDNTKILQKIGMNDVIIYDGDNAVYEGNYTVTDYEITF